MESAFIKQYIDGEYSKYVSEMVQVESDHQYAEIVSNDSIESSITTKMKIGNNKKKKGKEISNFKYKELNNSKIKEKIEEVTDKSNRKRIYMSDKMNQPRKNIGIVGMVSEGKSTLTLAVSNQATQRSKKEMERNITMKIGYADSKIWKKDGKYVSEGYNRDLISECTDNDLIDHISIVDCPGHFELITTMISSVRLMHAVIVVVSVEGDLDAKTSLKQHLNSVKLSGIKDIIVCLNKIDLYSNNREKLIERYNELKKFLDKFDIEPIYPIIPTSFQNNIGTDLLLDAIGRINGDENPDDDSYFLSNRSFSINRPGCSYDNVIGSCIGGSLLGGSIDIEDDIEIRPGIGSGENYIPIRTRVSSLRYNSTDLESIKRGGLISIGTDLIPSIASNNGLSGKLVGRLNTLPSVYQKLIICDIKNEIFGNIWDIGNLERGFRVSIQFENQLVISKFDGMKEDNFMFKLKDPMCISEGKRVIFLKNDKKGTQILGFGTFIEGMDKLE